MLRHRHRLEGTMRYNSATFALCLTVAVLAYWFLVATLSG